MLRLIAVGLMLVACAGSKKTVRSETCQSAFDRCNNGCFRSPHFAHGGPQCAVVGTLLVCPQEGQVVDTVASARCFERCEWDDKLCR